MNSDRTFMHNNSPVALHYKAAVIAAVVQEHGSYYHLEHIGLLPEARGQGLGSQLIVHGLAAADANNRCAVVLAFVLCIGIIV